VDDAVVAVAVEATAAGDGDHGLDDVRLVRGARRQGRDREEAGRGQTGGEGEQGATMCFPTYR
jgi:hypothetical protein